MFRFFALAMPWLCGRVTLSARVEETSGHLSYPDPEEWQHDAQQKAQTLYLQMYFRGPAEFETALAEYIQQVRQYQQHPVPYYGDHDNFQSHLLAVTLTSLVIMDALEPVQKLLEVMELPDFFVAFPNPVLIVLELQDRKSPLTHTFLHYLNSGTEEEAECFQQVWDGAKHTLSYANAKGETIFHHLASAEFLGPKFQNHGMGDFDIQYEPILAKARDKLSTLGGEILTQEFARQTTSGWTPAALAVGHGWPFSAVMNLMSKPMTEKVNQLSVGLCSRSLKSLESNKMERLTSFQLCEYLATLLVASDPSKEAEFWLSMFTETASVSNTQEKAFDPFIEDNGMEIIWPLKETEGWTSNMKIGLALNLGAETDDATGERAFHGTKPHAVGRILAQGRLRAANVPELESQRCHSKTDKSNCIFLTPTLEYALMWNIAAFGVHSQGNLLQFVFETRYTPVNNEPRTHAAHHHHYDTTEIIFDESEMDEQQSSIKLVKLWIYVRGNEKM